MWLSDTAPDDQGPEPSPGQKHFEERAREQVAALKIALERLTIGQQRHIIREIAEWGIYKDIRPVGYEDYAEREK